ncbi:MAG TPA: beta-L-arabinofuranosidase domain-containing protein [Blastocatellia bacterium]|nr:beta-L-arabinofuranosidase domain-containing protein [Blastocatellia bacterium]
MKRSLILFLRLLALTQITISQAQTISQPGAQIADRFSPVDPGAVQIHGFLGERCKKNERAWLLTKNEDELLGGFQRRPGKQAWVGEHAGKWLHAATLAWAYTKSEALRAKLDRVASSLIATQKPDGYLGTYVDDAHWGMSRDQKWDVWVHKYDLIGLITYHTYTGDKAALEASKKIGDLLVKTFGRAWEAESKLDLNERSAHAGMASGSVLEPMVLLYRATGDGRYLEFARYIAEHWEDRKGPKLISSLTDKKSVKQTADAKAYEMMSCLVGLCELYRATGETRYMTPAVNAWNDIVSSQLLITGSGGGDEHWTEPRAFPSSQKDHVAETCVTVTWIQLTQQLLRLTGEARYADELEKTFYNHLAAAQRPDGAAWAYFTALDGKKPYQTEQNCGTSSGPRGWAMLPALAYMISDDGVVINFYTPGQARIKIGGEEVTVKQATQYPADGRVAITVTTQKPQKFSLRARVPSWSNIAGVKAQPNTYWLLRQTWSGSQTITLDFALPTRVINGAGVNAGKIAVARGPMVLAVDEQYNPGGAPISAIALTSQQPQLKTSVTYRDADGLPAYETAAIVTQDTGKYRAGEVVTLRLVPFASAGAYGNQFSVWLSKTGGSRSGNDIR